MRKIVILLLALILNSCNDGNFEVPSFDFTETVNHCGEYILYITNTEKKEVMILTLSPDEINTTEGTKSYPILSPIQVNYRIFDAAIGTTYFCQSIPPASPNVLKDLNATDGEINITTTAVKENDIITGYDYTITITNLLFKDGDQKVFFETFNFGTLQLTN
jgi:hypothetical protein